MPNKSLLSAIILLFLAFLTPLSHAKEKPKEFDICECKYSSAIAWYRLSPEMQAVHYQIYNSARLILKDKVEKEDLKPGTWGVILDIDATIVDSSLINAKQRCSHLDKNVAHDDMMNYFRNDKDSTILIPGALAFLKDVERMGGYISLITNRDTTVKISTKHILKRLHVPYNQVIFHQNDSKKKISTAKRKIDRFNSVSAGSLPSTLPAHKVIMFVGDNIYDFPDMASMDMNAITNGKNSEEEMQIKSLSKRLCKLQKYKYKYYRNHAIYKERYEKGKES